MPSHNSSGTGRNSPHNHGEPDEHTRLLPSRIDSTAVPPQQQQYHQTPPPPGGYLSPDDPAVTPYNLWTVRLVRQLTVLLTIATFAWWTILLVSAFVTPPGLHTRGGGWFGFAYASISLGALAVTLLFFAAPSQASRVLAVVTAGLLAVDLVVMLAVAGMRREEAWAGVVACAWALVVVIWALVADRTVEWGKTEEERRLTGRPETRRTLLEWTEVVLSGVAFGVMAVGVLLMTMVLVVRAVDQGLEMPGERYQVDGGKYGIHVYCYGNRTKEHGKSIPTVLIEADEDPVEFELWPFADAMVKNGSIARYCFADRPGMAWSETAPSPFSASIATDALSEALARAGEHGPWVLVSAGVGSIYSRVFSSRHNQAVKGILLIDPLHEDLLDRIGNSGRGFWLWFRGIISPLGLDRIPGVVFRGRRSADRVWGVSAYQNGKTITAKLQECLVADSLTKRDVVSSRAIQKKDTPLVMVSSGVEMRKNREWEKKQTDLTHVTDKLVAWDIVAEAPHQVWRTYEGREAIEHGLKKLLAL